MSDKLNQLIELLKLEKIDDLIFRGASEDLGFRQSVWRSSCGTISFCCDASCPRLSVYSILAMLTF